MKPCMPRDSRVYFGVDADILRDILQTKLPTLESAVTTLLRE